MRHKEEASLVSEKLVSGYFIFVLAFFILYESFVFGFAEVDFAVICVGSVLVLGALYMFRPMVFPELTNKLSPVSARFLKFMGRHSLLIYVVHLVILKSWGFYLYPQDYSLFELVWLR
jgi:peptidoglycan/LPS O-acetylase OafA/YrhL